MSAPQRDEHGRVVVRQCVGERSKKTHEINHKGGSWKTQLGIEDENESEMDCIRLGQGFTHFHQEI